MKAAFHTLGCKVNQYETEAMKKQFKRAGFEIADEYEYADVYVINTCSVTALADRKSRQYIRRMKKTNPLATIAVTGCYAQGNKDEVAAIDGVDIVAGTNEKDNIIDYVNQHIKHRSESDFNFSPTEIHVLDYENLATFKETGDVTLPESRTRAYVKIQEGCNRFCTYCIIPYVRGPIRSRATNAVISECKALIENGYKELILTGINTALCENLEEILDELEKIQKDFRIRLSSLEPTVINAEYVKRLFKYKKLCHFLHLSLQSGSDKILEMMNRRYDSKQYLDIIDTLREFDPLYGISTDIIVGFPGETNEDFADSINIAKRAQFCKVHAFKYSKRKGTKAAEFNNQISPQLKKERSKKLIEASEEVANKFIQKNLGTKNKVLFEEYDENAMAVTGYTDNYIKAYMPLDKNEVGRYKNRFFDATLEKPLNDGVLVSLDYKNRKGDEKHE